MSDPKSQEQWAANEYEAALLPRMGLNEWQARKLIQESGFEFRYVDPDVHCGPHGLIFGHRLTHEKLFAWFEKELAKPVAGVAAPAPEVVKEAAPKVVKDKVAVGKGQRAYEMFAQGMRWVEISKELGVAKAQVNAMAHHKANGLPWPPVVGEASPVETSER